MKINNPSLLRAVLPLLLAFALPLVVAQDERVQESVSSSDNQTNFAKTKAAPSKIDSVFYQDFLKKREECRREREKLAQLETKARKRADEAGRTALFEKDQQAIAIARAKVEKAEAAMKDAERKANAD